MASSRSRHGATSVAGSERGVDRALGRAFAGELLDVLPPEETNAAFRLGGEPQPPARMEKPHGRRREGQNPGGVSHGQVALNDAS